ncbi:multidrug resistance-associated 4-like [Paramuricea clavata]|uniref:Multidrug resistance-associated 4-like n=1 Tax=Paramuricea clavata TaxID=317549 RepID=A0A6S7H8B6_PARCT|nr:multidrug resistance-associated 4-like [Paramuricea clavata]
MHHENVHRKDRANIISRVLLWWIVDLLWRGYKNPLNQEYLDPVREGASAAHQTKRLEGIWNNEKISARQQNKKPKLWKAMIKYFTWQEHALVNCLMLLNVFGTGIYFYSVTNLIKAIGSNLEQGTHSPNEYLIFIGFMMIGSSCEVLGSQHSCLLLPMLGIKARAALVGLIYKKVLRCSKMSMNAGEVMELLLYFVGWKFLPGLGVFTILALFRLCMTKIDINYRKKASQFAEKRLGYLREVLTIIHSVKLNCLEHVYEKKIRRTRWQEIKYKAKRWIILSASFSFTTCGQHLSTFVIVLVLIYTDRSMLTFDNLFKIMVMSVGIGEIICLKLPISIHFSTGIITGLTRIQQFLESCDATHDTINEFPPTKGKVSEIDEKSRDDEKSSEVVRETPYVCLDNVFCKLLTSNASYAQTEDVILLTDISITISSKQLVIITGSVGSGKSSLLLSILHGELHLAKGSVKQFGNIAYVPDTPWVFPGTIRENILFGLAYDEEWYSNTIKACQLERDFKRFPDQDLSHIGEHGATLSGGQRTRIALARAVYSRADISTG